MERLRQFSAWTIGALMLVAAILCMAHGCGAFEPVTLNVRIRGTVVGGNPDQRALSTLIDALAEKYPGMPQILSLQSELEGLKDMTPAFVSVLSEFLASAQQKRQLADAQALMNGATAFVRVWKADVAEDHATVSELATQLKTFGQAAPATLDPYVGEISLSYINISSASAQAANDLRSILALTVRLDSPEVARQVLAAANTPAGQTQLETIEALISLFPDFVETEQLVFAHALNRTLSVRAALANVVQVARFLGQLSVVGERSTLLQKVSSLVPRPDALSPQAWLSLIHGEVVVAGVRSEVRADPLPWINQYDVSPWVDWGAVLGARSYDVELERLGVSDVCTVTDLARPHLPLEQCIDMPFSDGSRYVLRIDAFDAEGEQVNAPHEGYAFAVDWTPPTVQMTVVSAEAQNGATPGMVTFAFSASDSAGSTSLRCSLDALPLTSCTSPVSFAGLDGAHMGRLTASDSARNQLSLIFPVQIGALPGSPDALYAVAPGAVHWQPEGDIELAWNAFPEAQRYTVGISNVQGRGLVCGKNWTTTEPSLSISDCALSGTGAYRYYVWALNGTNTVLNPDTSGAALPAADSATPTPTFAIGGSVAGLTGTVVLKNNGGAPLSLNSNGPFSFATEVAAGGSYAVTVFAHPIGQTCAVSNGSGSNLSADVTNVAVVCAADTHTISGTVSGLTGTVVLQNGGADDVSVAANGPFTFSTAVTHGAGYAVTIRTQPVGQTCGVSSGIGTAMAAVSNITVTCVTNTYTIGGTIAGLAGTVVLRNNGGDDLSRSGNGPFTFATSVAHGGAYSVMVSGQPAGQTCTVGNGSGTNVSAGVSDVTVSCSSHAPVLAAVGDRTATEGTQLAFSLSATDADGDTLAFSCKANCPSGLTVNATSGAVSWLPGYSAGGTYANVTFAVSDPGLLEDTEAITITVNESAGAPITVVSTTPASPANENSPVVHGTTIALASVKLFSNGSCTTEIASGTSDAAGDFSLGIAVADDSLTTIHARVQDAGGWSDCSSSSITFREDSTAPSLATFTGITPSSPANNNGPRVEGVAEAGSTVTLYADSDCLGSALVSGTAAAFASPGLLVSVADDTTTTFWATARDAANNTSACSSTSISYQEISTPTVAAAIGAPSQANANSGSTVNYTVTYTGAQSVSLTETSVTLNTSGDATCSVAVLGAGLTNRTVRLTSCTGSGTVGMSLEADSARDVAGNPDPGAGPSATFAVDNSSPTVAIGAPSTALALSSTSISFPVTYSGATSVNLTSADVSITPAGSVNCATKSVSNGTTATPTVTVSGCTGDGSFTIAIAAGKSSDAAGNTDAGASPSGSVSVDNTPPTVAIGAPSATHINAASTLTFGLTYSGTTAVNVTAANITVTPTGTVSCSGKSVSNGTTTTPTVTLTNCSGDGSLTIAVAAGRGLDAAGNPDGGTDPSASVTVDNAAPTVAIGAPSIASARSASSITFNINYSGATSVGLTNGDVTIIPTGTVTCSGVSVSNGTSATPTVTVSGCGGNGAFTLAIVAGKSTDTVGNSDIGAGPSSAVTVDNTPPTVAISAPGGGGGSQAQVATNSSIPVTFALAYSDDLAVNGITLAAGDVTLGVTGTAACTKTITGSGTATRTLTLTNCTGNGSVTVSVNAGTATDGSGNPSSGAGPSASVEVDNTLPVLTAASLFLNGGSASTTTPIVEADLAASDTTNFVTHFCLRSNLLTTPTRTDGCWTEFSPAASSASVAASPFTLGLLAGSYTVYAFVKDAAGNISQLSNGGVGTAGMDKATINYLPPTPPAISEILATNTDSPASPPSDADLTIAAGADVVIKWKAVSAGGFIAQPISLMYTTDDVTYHAVPGALQLVNGQNGACTINHAGTTADDNDTGCFLWSGGAPTAGFFRILLRATDQANQTTAMSSSAINAGKLRFLAGNTDLGTNASASAAVFLNRMSSTQLNLYGDPRSFVITRDGTLYFRDVMRGILKVSPADGIVRVFLQETGIQSGDGGPVASATLKRAFSIILDARDRLIIHDYDRLRRVNLDQNPVTIETIVGGGGSLADTTAALDLQWSPVPGSLDQEPNFRHISGWALPNGDLLWTSDGMFAYGLQVRAGTGGVRLLHYHSDSGQVTSYRPSGTGSNRYPFLPLTQPDCRAQNFFVGFDANSNLSKVIFAMDGSCSGPSYSFTSANLDPATFVATAPHPIDNLVTSFALPIFARNGEIYAVHRMANAIYRFDTGSNQWVRVVGSGTRGSCADGVAATSCAVDIVDGFVDEAGRLYFVDQGRIRMVDGAGNVQTLFGQGVFSGDGEKPLDARFAKITSVEHWNDGGTDRFVILDPNAGRFREISATTVETIAGNSNNIPADNINPGLNQGIQSSTPLWGYELGSFGLDPATGDVMYSRGGFYYSRLVRSTGIWTDVAGTLNNAMTPFFLAAADGLPGNQVYMTDPSWANAINGAVLGFDGTRILTLRQRCVPPACARFDGNLKTYRLSDGQQGHVAGTTWGSPTNAYCGEGTPLSNCTVPFEQAIHSRAQWDGTRWLVHMMHATTYTRILALAPGGTMQYLVTLPRGARAFAYLKSVDSSVEKVFFCAYDDGKIYAYDMKTSTETALPWPVASMQCSGMSLIYVPTRNSLVFPYTQNSLTGVAELRDVESSRPAQCAGLPANAQWNTAGGIVQQAWSTATRQWASIDAHYDTNVSGTECHFSCTGGTTWDGSSCL